MKNYIFDFDGTLANSGKTAILATQAAFKDFDLPLPAAADIEYYMGVPIEVSFKKMTDKEFTSAQFAELISLFRVHYKAFESENLVLFPEMEHVLEKMSVANKSMFVLSSKHSVALNRNLEQLNVLQHFQAVCGSDQVKKYKPAPDGILHILEANNLKKNETIMIGDAIYDLQMGRTAGVFTCGVTWGAHASSLLEKEKPDYLVDKVIDLLKI
ncbi:HAD family hydrolase [Liquorilactobacillus uvarum]|uniref:Phosphatase n=1 Tax=Liquorilactobacillus uvarum DSM 19971 TaxID=1423812 RepID=A0A0R1PZF6_9LACO|nr:HAD family hydrolase [Liquorilactobacillus uvarum]KRL37885.1 hypothetical protein FD20_GL002423 [Liquorilactobacillus uvarum DSM 19971]